MSHFDFMLDETEILALEKRLAAEYQADLAAIRRVLRLLRDKPAETLQADHKLPKPTHHPELSIASPNGTVESRVLFTIQQMKERFTFPQLLAALEANFPGEEINRKTVSGVMFRHKGSRIRVIQPGHGRKGAIYEKM